MRGKKLDETLISKIIEAYNSGKSSRQVAKEFGISKSSVLEYAKPKVLSDDELVDRRKKRTETQKKKRHELKNKCIEYKGGCCEICGYNKCKGALEFHHVDPTKKDFAISHKAYRFSWEKVQNELDKCIMVCANCHREIHEGLIDL
jgi:predicted transcriptional regulator